MKTLTEQEILAIAGGLPPGVALDDALFRAPAEPLLDPIAFAALAGDEHPDDSAR
jgi:hypothetical protein